MNSSQRSAVIGRRTILKAGAAAAALQVTSPFIIRALGDTPVRIGMVDPVTGVYAAVAQGELEGAKLATDQVNKNGGILGRPLTLLIENSANDVGVGVQKTRKLIERDQVSFIIGDVNSAIALAMTQVTSEKRVLHIVSGGHTDPITGSELLVERFSCLQHDEQWMPMPSPWRHHQQAGQKVVLSYAGLCLWALGAGRVSRKYSRPNGGTSAGSLIPIGTADYSAYLIQAKAFRSRGGHQCHGWRRPGQQPQAVCSIRAGQADGRRRHTLRARKLAGHAQRSAHRLVDDGMVVGPAGHTARQGVQRRNKTADRPERPPHATGSAMRRCTPLR